MPSEKGYRQPHDRAYLRKQRYRLIKKRQRIIRQIWRSKDNELLKKPGRLAKYNLACSCPMCKEAKKSGPDELIAKALDKEKRNYFTDNIPDENT